LKKGVTPQNNADKENNHRIGQAMATIDPPPRNTKHPAESTEKRPPWWMCWGTWKESLQVVGIAAAIAYAIITYFQWKDLRHNFEADQRAWVKLGYTWPPLNSDRPATMNGLLVNTGKSPITTLYAEGALEVVNSNNPPSFGLHERHSTHGEALLFPGDNSLFPINLYDPTTKQHRAFTPDEIIGLRNGTSYVAAFGVIIYTDHFNVHWYRFCNWTPDYAMVSGNVNAGECVNWNRAGDGKPTEPFEK
jgi:hypothetical protein